MVNKNFMKLVKRQMNSKLPVGRKESEKTSRLTQILERDENGKLKLNLTSMKNTGIHTLTQEDYLGLMRVYECGGWKWGNGYLPTTHNVFKDQEGYKKEEICIEAGTGFLSGESGKFGYGSIRDLRGNGWNVISTKEFYEKQKVSLKIRKQIKKEF